MTVRSLGYRTDLFFPRFDAEVVDRGEYLVVRTPSNPNYYWGNFLLFDRPPAADDFERWRAIFAEEIGGRPGIHHIALGWDGVDGEKGDVGPFVEAGFDVDESVVLSATRVVRPAKFCEEAEIRPLAEEWEWQAALDNFVANRDEEYSEEGYRLYASRKMDRDRAMVAAGLGQWFGAFVGGELAGDLGLFVIDGVGRFQRVGTHPKFRRRGVCGALVYQTATEGFERMGAETLVMVADPEYHAARIYESVGFVPVERQIGMTWWDRNA